jgi:hypothetical protein
MYVHDVFSFLYFHSRSIKHYVCAGVFILYFYSRSTNMNPPGNKDPLIIISLIKAGQLQPQLQRWQCWLRQRSGSAQQRQRSVSNGSGSVSVNGGCISAVAVWQQRQPQP